MLKKRPAVLMFIACFIFAAAGCTTVQHGASGNKFISAAFPALALEADHAMSLYASGGRMVRYENETFLPSSGYMDYAIYGTLDGAKVLRHAHLMRADISSDGMEFEIESLPGRYGAYVKKYEKAGLNWTEQLRYAQSEGDWFSNYWAENGFEVPETWLVMRYSTTYFGAPRMIMEYREPMPEGIEIGSNVGKSYFAHAVFEPQSAEAKEAFNAFKKRAESAFTVVDGTSLADKRTPLEAQKLPVRPKSFPNMSKLVGKVKARPVLVD